MIIIIIIFTMIHILSSIIFNTYHITTTHYISRISIRGWTAENVYFQYTSCNFGQFSGFHKHQLLFLGKIIVVVILAIDKYIYGRVWCIFQVTIATS